MLETNEKPLYLSEFNVALFILPIFIAIILLTSMLSFFFDPAYHIGLSDILLFLLFVLIALLPVLMLYKKVAIYKDRIEAYNIFNRRLWSIHFNDIKKINYANSSFNGGNGQGLRSNQSIRIFTIKGMFSFSSILFLNLRAFKVVLEANVPVN